MMSSNFLISSILIRRHTNMHSFGEAWRIPFLYFIVTGFTPMLAFSSTRINYVRIKRNKWQSQRTPFHAFKDILSTRHIWRGTRLRNSHENSLENTAVHDVQEQSNSHSKEKEIIVTSTIKLPFSAHTAFDAFSDLTRQPTWSHWLKSVQYIHGDGDPSYPTTKWTLGWRGFTFSWIAKSTKLVRPHVIEWESISGLKNRGTVKFVELNGSHSKEDHKTEMELTLIFMTPRIVSTMFHNSGRIKSMIETSVIQKTLVNFRDVVIQQDLKG